MLASEAGNLEVVNQLLNIGFPVNLSLKINGKSTADLAWENQNQKILLTLLKADSQFPKSFDISKAAKEVSSFVNEIEKFIQNIENEDFDSAEEFLKEHPSLRNFYDLKNFRGTTKAIQLKKFNVLNFLLKNGTFLEFSEDVKNTVSNLNDKELHHLKIMLDDSKASSHNNGLMRATKAIDRGIVEDVYKELDRIPGVNQLLRAIAKNANAPIYFDFDRSFDETSALKVPNCIYIPAKNLLDPDGKSEALALIARQLCDFAVDLTFKNDGKPYSKGDEIHQKVFEAIYEECKENVSFVPQLLVLGVYGVRDINESSSKFKNLWNYYESFVLKEIEKKTNVFEQFVADKFESQVDINEESDEEDSGVEEERKIDHESKFEEAEKEVDEIEAEKVRKNFEINGKKTCFN